MQQSRCTKTKPVVRVGFTAFQAREVADEPLNVEGVGLDESMGEEGSAGMNELSSPPAGDRECDG